MRPTLPCAGAGLPVLPGIPAAEESGRSRDFGALREFRQRLSGCLTARADALFELADAVLCADGPVSSLVQLSLEPEFRRGHGALYDALSAGGVDDERLFSLFAEALPPLVDGPEGRAWTAERDVIDRGLLDRALAGVPAADAARVRDACAGGRRVRVAVDATAYPRPDAWCSPGREHVHNGACHCRGSSKTAPGWEYQLAAVTGRLRTAWAAFPDVRRTLPATRTAQTITQVKSVLRRLRAAGHAGGAAPLFVFDAGYSAAALTDGLAGCAAHVLVRLPAGSVFYQDAVTWGGKNGRPARRGPEVHCLEPEALAAAAEGHGSRGRKKPLPPAPEPDEALILPATPLCGTVRAEARHDVHPQVHGDRGWFAGRERLPVLRGTLVHVTAERLPREIRHRARDPHAQGHPRPHRREGPRTGAGRPPDQGRDRGPGPAPARPPPRHRPAPPLGEAARPDPAAIPGPGPPGVPQHPPPDRHPRPGPETRPARPRQAQRKQHRPRDPPPAPRRSRHAPHHEHGPARQKVKS